jgi:hypothetical protein
MRHFERPHKLTAIGSVGMVLLLWAVASREEICATENTVFVVLDVLLSPTRMMIKQYAMPITGAFYEIVRASQRCIRQTRIRLVQVNIMTDLRRSAIIMETPPMLGRAIVRLYEGSNVGNFGYTKSAALSIRISAMHCNSR